MFGWIKRYQKNKRDKELLDLFVNWETFEQLRMYVREGFHPDIAEKAIVIKMSKWQVSGEIYIKRTV